MITGRSDTTIRDKVMSTHNSEINKITPQRSVNMFVGIP